MWTTVVMEGVRREVRVALSAPFGSKCNWDGWKQCYELEQTKGNYVADHESHVRESRAHEIAARRKNEHCLLATSCQ